MDEFHVLTYMMATMMAPNGVFMNGPVIITALLNAVNELKNMVTQNPDLPLLGNATIRSYLEKGSSFQVSDAAKKMRSDIEVYCGFMMIPLALVGTASWMAPLTYWQMTRMRYMISVNLQQAWMRFDQQVQANVLCYLPGAVAALYFKAKTMLAGMVDVEQ